ncbi:hypothetical protein [Acidipila rosea]|uniref:Uncharacterized protein n=1 Tax=Acidipila rosea TaxID=768535 RepID=A0A4R1L6S5_9BACT|nr:hypothetical protein [Acidipila rosea]TCK71989.1 hypothetical protein C7378_2614 [Acidipila rosea]
MSAALTLPMVWANGSTWRKEEETDKEPLSTVAFYRRHTEVLLRRYMQISMLMGRVPSMIGSGVFRGRVSSYRVRSFEDAVIFVYDVEKCLKRLDAPMLELITRIALQEYTQSEAAGLTGQSLRSVVRKYSQALDQLTAIFLELEILQIDGRRGRGCR